jgi:cyclopropane fatty-acyl-phospholipid synthase-like methyltransferase
MTPACCCSWAGNPMKDSRMTPAARTPDPAASEQVDRFNAMYDAGAPPWDIGRPQPAFLELADQGALRGRVLDLGCGTGEHALMAAAHGLEATGIDAVPNAITIAQRKARDRGLDARFLVWDALRLPELGEQFDIVLDSGLFHVFDDEDRARYVASLRVIIPTGGRYYMLCFSDRQPGATGPRRVSQSEIRQAFASPDWQVDAIDAMTMETNMDDTGVRAWRASISRI